MPTRIVPSQRATYARSYPERRITRSLTIWKHREAKFNPQVLIDLRCRSKVELVSRDFATMLVPDIKCCPGQNVVMNLLRRATILEYQCDRLLALWGG